MTRLIKTVVSSSLLAATLVALMLVPIFTAAGVAAYVWGGAILDTVLGDPPDLRHPAFWVFLALMVGGMLLAAALGYCLIGLPVLAKLKRSGSDIEIEGGGAPLLPLVDALNRYLAKRMRGLALAYAELMTEWAPKR